MTCTAPILGCFILFCLLGVQAEEVPNQLNPIADNVTDSNEVNETLALNTSTELKPKNCKEILQNLVDDSINNVSSFLSLRY